MMTDHKLTERGWYILLGLLGVVLILAWGLFVDGSLLAGYKTTRVVIGALLFIPAILGCICGAGALFDCTGPLWVDRFDEDLEE